MTAGVALVGAGAIAITPMTVPTAASHRVVDAATTLTASFEGMSQEVLIGMTVGRLAEQFVQAPLVPLVVAAQVAGGDEERLYMALKQLVDMPLYVADPAIEAIANTLPESLGGGSDHLTNKTDDGAFMQFRNTELLGLRDKTSHAIGDALGVDGSVTEANYTWDLVQGLQTSAVRVASTAVTAPLGLIPIAQAIAKGEDGKLDLYMAIRQYTDAPLWAADPTISGLARALPESLGGATTFDAAGRPTDGGMGDFRLKAWETTRDTRVAIAKGLGLNPGGDDSPLDSDGNERDSKGALLRNSTPEPDQPPASTLASREAQESNMSEREIRAQARKERAEARAERVQARTERAQQRAQARADRVQARAEKAKDAVQNVTKKLTPKKATPKKQDKKKNSDD